MIPNMYKIAGELTSTVFHVAARSIAAQGLSIFGDHSDVMAVRQTGFALLSSASVQEAHDLALVAQAATLRTRVPFVHFFDGFRTSHEINTMEPLGDEVLRAMINDELVRAHRTRALTPDRPVLRGTAQNPDVYFQARESVNPFYNACPAIVQQTMVDPGLIDWAGVAERMSAVPARIGRLDGHGRAIAEGEPANLVLYDPAATHVVEASEMASLSRNTPYAGMELPGRVVATFLRGTATVLDGKPV